MEKECAGATDVLESFANDLLNKGRAENTVKTYVGVLHSFSNWLVDNHDRELIQTTKEDVQSYMDFLEVEQRSTATIDKIYNTICAFMRFLGYPEITKGIRRKEKDTEYTPPESLTEEQIQQLIEQIEGDGNPRNIAIVYTLLYTGIRVSELCALNKKDLQNDKLIIRNRDNEISRQIPMSKRIVKQITTYLAIRDDDNEALFLSNYQKRISARTVQHMLKQYDVHPHKLRHTFCYELVRKGVDLAIIAQLAGHSDINVTKQYTVESKRSHLEDVINKMYA